MVAIFQNIVIFCFILSKYLKPYFENHQEYIRRFVSEGFSLLLRKGNEEQQKEIWSHLINDLREETQSLGFAQLLFEQVKVSSFLTRRARSFFFITRVKFQK